MRDLRQRFFCTAEAFTSFIAVLRRRRQLIEAVVLSPTFVNQVRDAYAPILKGDTIAFIISLAVQRDLGAEGSQAGVSPGHSLLLIRRPAPGYPSEILPDFIHQLQADEEISVRIAASQTVNFAQKGLDVARFTWGTRLRHRCTSLGYRICRGRPRRIPLPIVGL